MVISSGGGLSELPPQSHRVNFFDPTVAAQKLTRGFLRLELVMQINIPPRPTVTDKMIEQAAKTVAAKVDIRSEDIIRVYRHSMDGFELAIELKDNCIDVDRSDMYELDEMERLVSEELTKAEKEWFTANDIQPPYPIGTRVTEGVIEHIDNYRVGHYLVRKWDTPPEVKSWLVIKFEKAVPAPEEIIA